MFKQICKIIWQQRLCNAWIWAEVGLVAIFLWYIADTLYVHLRTYSMPLGYDIEHTYLASFRAVSDESYQYIPEGERTTSTADDLLTVVDRIRTCPGVEAVSISEGAYPYNNMASYTSLFRDTAECGRAHRKRVTPDFFRVFRVKTPDGETQPLVDNLALNRLVISEDIAKHLYPEGNAQGKEIGFEMEDTLPKTVAAVASTMRYDDFQPAAPVFFFLMGKENLAVINELLLPYAEICLRVTPEADDKDFPETFRRLMSAQLRYNNLYLLDIRPFSEIRERFLSNRMNDFKMYLAIILFLLANIFLGVAGTFWFRTQHRQGEMGLRMAMGSTGGQLRALLMGEGMVLLVAAFLPAMLAGLNIGWSELVNTELMPFTPARFFFGQLATFILLAAMILAGISFPARKATRLKPVEALRYE